MVEDVKRMALDGGLADVHPVPNQIQTRDDMIGYSLHGYVSNANYNVKKGTYIFFINSMSSAIRHRANHVDAVPATYLWQAVER